MLGFNPEVLWLPLFCSGKLIWDWHSTLKGLRCPQYSHHRGGFIWGCPNNNYNIVIKVIVIPITIIILRTIFKSKSQEPVPLSRQHMDRNILAVAHAHEAGCRQHHHYDVHRGDHYHCQCHHVTNYPHMMSDYYHLSDYDENQICPHTTNVSFCNLLLTGVHYKPQSSGDAPQRAQVGGARGAQSEEMCLLEEVPPSTR